MKHHKQPSQQALALATANDWATSGDVNKRLAVAGDPSMPPELLYFLTADVDASVRACVAQNKAMPYPGDLTLSTDRTEEVRVVLATKLAHYVQTFTSPPPHMDALIGALKNLATDSSLAIRQTIARAIHETTRISLPLLALLEADNDPSIQAIIKKAKEGDHPPEPQTMMVVENVIAFLAQNQFINSGDIPDILSLFSHQGGRKYFLERKESVSVYERVLQDFAKGLLTEENLDQRLVMGEKEYTALALAVRAGVDAEIIKRALRVKHVKAIVSFCWKAGLSARFSLAAQQKLAQISPAKTLYPRNGTDYPLSETDLIWHIELFEKM